MRKTPSILIVVCLLATAQAAENVRKVGTWNMKWLGVASGNQLDPIESVPAARAGESAGVFFGRGVFVPLSAPVTGGR